MAVKKSTAPKSSTKAAPKAKAAKKAAPQAKAAPKPKADTKATAKAPKAGAKKAAPKKAPAVKLTDPQRKLLGEVAGKKTEGVLGTKGTAKQLGALLEKKLIKKGKKEGEFFRYFITKTGEKHAPAGGAAPSAETSSAPAS
jgi:hypothetical protein